MNNPGLILLILCLSAATMYGQATLGSAAVSGTVRDSSGAAIPGAKIALTETAHGLSRETTSNTAGSFTLKEQTRLEFRGEVFNAFNHAQFTLLSTDTGSGANFGRISSAKAPRLIQLGLKLIS